MDDLTVDQVTASHAQVMNSDGGDDRLFSETGLHQMVFSANRIEGVFPRAAFAFFSLVAYPVYLEGNSRTAQLVAEMILNRNGFTLEDGDADMAPLVQGIASFTLEQEDIEEWLHSHHKKTTDQ